MDTLISNTTDISQMGQDVWITDEACLVFQWVLLAVTCQIVIVFGTIGNVINIICFIKQGFQDSVNVNFLGLAVTDMGCLVTIMCINVAYTPMFQEVERPFDAVELSYLTFGWPHFICARVSSLITALITVERCLCITVPLKVKSLMTPKRVGIIIVVMFLIVTISVIPWYCTNRLGWKYSPEKNRSILGLTFTPGREIAEAITYTVNHTVVPFIAFLVIIVCTCVLVISLKRKSRWRKKSKALRDSQDLSNREHKVVKMVVAISTLFIACYFPMSVLFISMMFIPGLAIDGKDFNVSIVIGGIGLMLESVNSSLNIFIYYNMSSRYKTIIRELFGLSQRSTP